MVSSEQMDHPQNQEMVAAKEAIKQGYVAAGLTLVEDNADSLVLGFKDRLFAVTSDDIRDFASCTTLRGNSKKQPVECGMVAPTYREQVVQPLDPLRWRYVPALELGFRFGDPEGEDAFITIGAATTEFVNFSRFDPAYLAICLERMARAPITDTAMDIRHGFYRPPTIRVHQMSEKSAKAALNTSTDLINYCLFELSYLKHLPVGLADEWPARRRLDQDVFRFEDDVSDNVLPMPSAEFAGDVVQLYQLGMSSRMPVLQFWAFYQVLEYFFVRVSDEHLHQSLATRLRDPRFKPTSAQLDRVVQDVLDHLETVDTLTMLANVLEKYVDEDVLIQFIKAYERHIGQEHYTKRRRLFGEDLQVKLSRGTVLENVARTILAIRQMLIYSPDRFSRTARNVGFDQLSETLKPEIPLMKFLAERVIIGSAS